MIAPAFRASPLLSPAILGFLLAGAIVPAKGQFPGGPSAPLPPLPQRRAEVLRQFDADGDGRLTGAEREAARQDWAKKQLSQRGDRGFFRPPQELMDEFDTNKDGEIDPDEGRVLGETMGRRMEKLQKDYDTNGNGRLDRDEVAAAGKDIDSGKLTGIPRMFLQFIGPGPGRPGGARGPRGPGGPRGMGGPGGEPDDPSSDELQRADRDQDGRLSAEELQSLREIQAARRKAAGSGAPAAPKP